MLGNEIDNEVTEVDIEADEDELLFVLTAKYLYAECYVDSNGDMFVDIRDDHDESLIETVPVESKDKKEAMVIAYNATIGKG
jgi:hypothetical protein